MMTGVFDCDRVLSTSLVEVFNCDRVSSSSIAGEFDRVSSSTMTGVFERDRDWILLSSMVGVFEWERDWVLSDVLERSVILRLKLSTVAVGDVAISNIYDKF
jgi:hypothetical protein